ncbi:MAG: ABC transporter ATP-binding protein [Lachnospiraceae bacterium]
MYITLKDVSKSYTVDNNSTLVLNNITTKFDKGTISLILGPSGSGKSTLLNVIGGLDTIDKGSIQVDGMDISRLPANELVTYRRNKIGFIFQLYNLVPDLTVRENILVCKHLTKSPLDVDELLNILEMTPHARKFPHQLSGGQQQRCAVARALVKNPSVLLCDEPTGALDYKSSKELLVLLESINRKYKTTAIIVTHNEALKGMAHHIIKLKDGAIRQDYVNETLTPAIELEW